MFLADRREICVADRENGRIQCFIAETGEFVKEIKKEEFAGKVFAITYSPVGGEVTSNQMYWMPFLTVTPVVNTEFCFKTTAL